MREISNKTDDLTIDLGQLGLKRLSLKEIREKQAKRKQMIAALYEDIERRQAHADALLGRRPARDPRERRLDG